MIKVSLIDSVAERAGLTEKSAGKVVGTILDELAKGDRACAI